MARGKNRKGVAYARVSRVGKRKGDSFISVELQDDGIEEVAPRFGVELVGDTLVDLDVSGKTMSRPALDEALRMIEDREASVLIVAKASRLARNVIGTYDVVRRVHDAGGSVIIAELNLDTANHMGKAMLGLMAVLAEMELDALRESWGKVTEHCIERGVRIHAAPVGYTKSTTRTLVPDPTRAPLVREVFTRRAQGAPWSEIREWWHGETGEWLKVGRFSTMVRNRAYLGELKLGERVIPNYHEPIVSDEEFAAAAATLAPRPPKSTVAPSLLAGVLICGGCRRPMTAAKAGKGVLTYRCQKRAGSGRNCEHPVAVSRHLADEYVTAEFLKHFGTVKATTTGDDSRLADAEAAVVTARQRLTAYMVATADSDADAEAIAAGASAHQAKLDAALAVRDEVFADRRLADVSMVVADDWDELETEERRRLIKAGVESVVVHATSRPATGARGPRVPFADRSTITWRSQVGR